ncbi:MAG: RNA polymerase sigma factor [Lachnospiraceae bacterium]|nr:RNA polymerase sigma factor [Lachnospiraceae bacterium]
MILTMTFDTPADKSRFEEIYETYKFLMMKVAYGVLQDRFLAEDAVHNAFVNISGKMAQLENMDETGIKRYLIVVTKNAAIDIWRKRKIRSEKEVEFDAAGEERLSMTGTESSVDNEILDAFQRLPDIYRDVFLLKYAHCLENDQIAGALKISESTVRQRIARGKVLLKKELEELNGRGN